MDRMGKNQKKCKQGTSSKSRNGQQDGTVLGGIVAGMRKFPRCSNFLVAPLFLHFLLFFPSGILSVMLSLTRILRAWIDSTILAQLARKNYKIFHKMLSVE